VLLLGLRDPVTKNGQAIVVPLLNPVAVVRERAAPAFGPPLLLDTGAAGVTSHLAEWTPPEPSELSRLDRTTPVAVPRACLCLLPLTAERLSSLGEHAVPEGIAVLEGETPDDDRFVVVQDPESLVPDDVFVRIVEGRRLLGTRK
jgi:hypothetical protein